MTGSLIKYCPCEWHECLAQQTVLPDSYYFVFIIISKILLPPFQRPQSVTDRCAFFVLIFHANLQTGQQQLLIQRSLPRLWPSLLGNEDVCLCLQVAAKPASLRVCSDSCRERAYPATSAVAPQVSLPHLDRRFSPFLPGQPSCSPRAAHLPQLTAQHMTANQYMQGRSVSPHPELTCPHFCTEGLQWVLLLPGGCLQRVTAAKSSDLDDRNTTRAKHHTYIILSKESGHKSPLNQVTWTFRPL